MFNKRHADSQHRILGKGADRWPEGEQLLPWDVPRPPHPARPMVRMRLLAVALLVCLAGLAAGLVADRLWSPNESGHYSRRSGYRLVRPLLDYEVAQEIEVGTRRLKQQVVAVADRKLRGKQATHLSVYFRDLNNGPWFGIGERELFSPASLLKVPLLIAYLKEAEAQPKLLSFELAYTGGGQFPESNIKPSEVIEEGRPYPVEELLSRMVIHSDNRAAAALFGAVNPEALNRAFRDLGVTVPDDRQSDYTVSVKTYATFFRILYNASYLSPEMSEKALDWLTKAGFTHGLAAGVPPGILVAHKFGERAVAGQRAKQFHDCGIVYCPQSPYVLCVMGRGEDTEELIRSTAEISRLVFNDLCR